MHQRCAADVVSGARGSSGVSVWAAAASGSVRNSGVIPVLRLPLHPLLLGSFSCSRFGGQHRWEWRFIIKGRILPKTLFKTQFLMMYCAFVGLFYSLVGGFGIPVGNYLTAELSRSLQASGTLFQVSWPCYTGYAVLCCIWRQKPESIQYYDSAPACWRLRSSQFVKRKTEQGFSNMVPVPCYKIKRKKIAPLSDSVSVKRI